MLKVLEHYVSKCNLYLYYMYFLIEKINFWKKKLMSAELKERVT